jgi:hypothetical protein
MHRSKGRNTKLIIEMFNTINVGDTNLNTWNFWNKRNEIEISILFKREKNREERRRSNAIYFALTTNTLPLKTIEIDDSKFILRLLIFNKYNIIISSLEIEKGSIHKTKSFASRQRFLLLPFFVFFFFPLKLSCMLFFF